MGFDENCGPRPIGQRPQVKLHFLGGWIFMMKLKSGQISLIAALTAFTTMQLDQLLLSLKSTPLLGNVGLIS